MTTLLERLSRQRKLVQDLREPERELEQLEAEYAAEQEARAQKTARLEQAQAELSDHERVVTRGDPREARWNVAIEVLDELADDAMHGRSQHINPYLLNQALTQIRGELELLANARVAQKRLQSEIRALKRDLGVR